MVLLVAGSGGEGGHPVLVGGVVQGAAAHGGAEAEPLDDLEVGAQGAAQVVIDALAVTARLQALQGVGVGAGRIGVGPVGILDLIDGGHAVRLLDDPLRPVGVVLDLVAGELAGGGQGEAVGDLVAHVQAAVVTVETVAGALEEAVLVQVTHGSHVGQVLRAARHGQVVGHHRRIVLVQLADPLDVGAAVAEVGDLLGRELGGTAGIDRGLVVEFGIDPGIDDRRKGRRLLHAVGEVIIDGDLSLRPLLRGDEDDAVGGAGSVDGGGGGVLQDGNLVDVVGVQVRERALDAVDDHERVVVVHRVETTDVHRRGAARGGRTLLDDEARRGALEAFQDVGDGLALELLGGDGGHGTGQVDLLLDTVTDDDRVVQEEILLREFDVEVRTALDGDLFRLIADGRHDKDVLRCGQEGEEAVHVGHRADGRALDEDRGADHGFAVGDDLAGNPVRPALGGRRRRRAQAEEEHGDGEEHLPEGDEPPGAAAPFTDLVRNHNEIGLVVYWLFLSISERAYA